MKKRFAVDGVSYDNPNRNLCGDIAQVRGLDFDLAKILGRATKNHNVGHPEGYNKLGSQFMGSGVSIHMGY